MTLYLYTNVLGIFLFNDKGDKIDETLFKKDFLEKFVSVVEGDWFHEEGMLVEKYKKEKVVVINNKKESFYDTTPADLNDNKDFEAMKNILDHFKSKQYFKEFRERNFILTRKDMKESPVLDTLIIQATHNVEELETTINTLSKRLREWYELYFPEASKMYESHREFSEVVLNKDKDEMIKEFKLKDSFGASLSSRDLEPITKLAENIISLFELKDNQMQYLDVMLEDYCPNLKQLLGTMITSKLLTLSGSLAKLANFPSSTVQTLGAEKAMFRHLKSGSKPPKYGVVLMHPLVNKAGNNHMKGKVARILANKVSLLAKVDYFGGESYKGYELKSFLEKEVEKLKTSSKARPIKDVPEKKPSDDKKHTRPKRSDKKNRGKSQEHKPYSQSFKKSENVKKHKFEKKDRSKDFKGSKSNSSGSRFKKFEYDKAKGLSKDSHKSKDNYKAKDNYKVKDNKKYVMPDKNKMSIKNKRTKNKRTDRNKR